VAPGRGHHLGQGAGEALGVVAGPAAAEVEGGLVDPDGQDGDGLVAQLARDQLRFQPGQQPLGGVAGDAQVEHGVGREADLAVGAEAAATRPRRLR
jgi:hypothetical protein